MRVTEYPIVTLPIEEEKQLIEKINIVFMTVTAVEREQFFVYLKPLANYGGIVKINGHPQTYHVGVFGKYIVAHTQCKMGSVGRDSSQNVTNDTLQEIQPSYIVMTGIAFGLKKKNKTLGDVLVSERIIPYEVARISKDTTDWRGDPIRSGVTLFSRFENAIEWNQKGKKRKTPYKIHPGSVLSGEKLVDRKEFVEILEEAFPKAVGGEMEGAGVSSVCDRKSKEWIVVKGICDWGEGKGKKHQKMAAKVSTNLAHHVFENTSDLGTVYCSDIDAPCSWEFNARKGSSLWALNRLRSDAFSQLIEDLKLQEESGIHDDVCLAVKEDLQLVIEALGNIPKYLSHGKTLEQTVAKFLEVYSDWNDIKGVSENSVEKRRKLISKLSKSRDNISKVVRSSSFLLGIGLSKETIDSAYQQQLDLVEKYPEIFPNLTQSVRRFRNNNK